MADMLREEHHFIKLYIFSLKIYVVFNFSWIFCWTIFNGTCFFGSIMDMIDQWVGRYTMLNVDIGHF